jgi:hypothetical protein
MSQKIQFRRGVDAQRTLVTPDVGEPVFATDTKEFYIGDGATPGGVLVTGAFIPSSYVQKLRGTAAIASGADSVTVSGLGLASVPAQVLVTVRKATGGSNLFASVRSDSLSTSGFTADLSAATDASTYALDYLVIL